MKYLSELITRIYKWFLRNGKVIIVLLVIIALVFVAALYIDMWFSPLKNSPEAIVALILGAVAIPLTLRQINEAVAARLLPIYLDYEKRLLSEDQHDARRFLYDTYSHSTGREKLMSLGSLTNKERAKVERVCKLFDALGNAIKRNKRLQRFIFSQYADVIIKCWIATETLIMTERRHQIEAGQGEAFMQDFYDLYIRTKRYCYLRNINTDNFQILPAPSQRKSEYFRLINKAPHPDLPSTLLADYISNLESFFDDKGSGAIKEKQRDDGTPSFLYSEATGYAINSLIALKNLTGDESFLNMANKSASWLIKEASDKNNWIRTRKYCDVEIESAPSDYSFSVGNIYTFDNGVCLSAFVNLYNDTHSSHILNMISKLANNFLKIASKYQNKESGYLPAIFDKNGIPYPKDSNRWSRKPGSYQTVIAEALLKAANCLDDSSQIDNLINVAVTICKTAIQDHNLKNNCKIILPKSTNVHAICYTAEGLFASTLELSKLSFREKKYLDEIKDFYKASYMIIDWLLKNANEGYIQQEIVQGLNSTQAKKYFRTDTIAQILKLGVAFYENPGSQWEDLIEDKDEWFLKLSELAQAILFQKDQNQGYFKYGYYEDGTSSNTLSFWTNMFAFDALWEYIQLWIKEHSKLVVLAGGKSERLWPILKLGTSKAFTTYFSSTNLLETTLERFNATGFLKKQNIIITLGKNHSESIAKLSSHGYVFEDEPKPKGTTQALRDVLEKLDINKDNQKDTIIVISTVDNLIKPYHLFRIPLQKAILTAANDEQDNIISVCIPSDKIDSRFGNILYRIDKSYIASSTYKVQHFIEKPNTLPTFWLKMKRKSKYAKLAWEGGCLIGRGKYILKLLSNNKSQDITVSLLENKNVHMLAEPLATMSGLKWVDAGILSEDLYKYLCATNYNMDSSQNVILSKINNKDKRNISLLKSWRNLIISDLENIAVRGISDCLIIATRFISNEKNFNIIIITPLSKSLTLHKIYNKLRKKWPLLFSTNYNNMTIKNYKYLHNCKRKSIKVESNNILPTFFILAYCKDILIKCIDDKLLIEALN